MTAVGFATTWAVVSVAAALIIGAFVRAGQATLPRRDWTRVGFLFAVALLAVTTLAIIDGRGAA